jgi:hypothetical protein
METISLKKVVVSYVVTSFILFFASALTSASGLFGNHFGSANGVLSMELMVLIQLVVVLLANAVMHWFFYYAGFHSSPIVKGITSGAVVALAYFMTGVFALNVFDINSDPSNMLAGAMSGRLFEYCTGGFATAVISVTDLHKWGLLRAF